MRSFLAGVSLVLLAAPALAESPPLPPTVLHLSETARQRVVRDRLRVDLRADETAAEPRTVEAAINRLMGQALAKARAVQGVEVETGSYAVYRESPPNRPAAWHGSQELVLTGTDAAALLKLAGELQSAGLVMSNLTYQASPEAVRGAEDDLTVDALSALDRRAAAIARQLHLSVLRYSELRVGNAQSNGPPPPRFAAMAAAPRAVPAPVAAPGETTVSVTITAAVLLGPERK
ncbi:MAG TPA: SIMPL domain-containing protein [Stellaceae bacterium]|nr:SIMPL domain-containing protein [Stellaceae bacterium]